MSVVIPIGPFHPALHEPSFFKVHVEGEKIVHTDIRLGYNHRGLEKICEARTIEQAIIVIERVCGICSQAHTTAYCGAVEDIAGIDIPERAAYIRSIFCEIERIHSHLLCMGTMFHTLGYEYLFMECWKLREITMDILEDLGGNRVHYSSNTIGGVRKDIDNKTSDRILSDIESLLNPVKEWLDIIKHDSTVYERLKGVGYLSIKEIKQFGAVGAFAKGGGIPIDARFSDQYAAYGFHDFKPVVESVNGKGGDCYSRAIFRSKECLQSIDLTKTFLDNLPDGDLVTKYDSIPAGESMGRTEAPRGEDVHYVRTNGGPLLDRIRVRVPTYTNLQTLPTALKGNLIGDVPVILVTMDPCFSCTER